MIITSKKLAEAMGVTEQLVTQEWVKKHGLPVHSRGSKGQGNSHQFLFKDFVLWYHRNQSIDETLSPQDQLALARTEEVKIRNQITRGELVNKNELVEEFFSRLKIVSDALALIPTQIYEQIEEEHGIQIDPFIIRDAIDVAIQKSYQDLEDE